MRHVLSTVEGVEVGVVTEAIDTGFNIGTPTPGQKPQHVDMLDLLKHCSRFHTSQESPESGYDFLFVITAYGGHSYWTDYVNYKYFSKSGELGYGREWCYVPEALKSQIQAINAQLMRKHYRVRNYGSVTTMEPIETRQASPPPLPTRPGYYTEPVGRSRE